MLSRDFPESLRANDKVVSLFSPRSLLSTTIPIHVTSLVNNVCKGKGKGKVLPRKGNEGPEGNRCIVLFFL